MIDQLPVFIVLTPLFGALLVLLVGMVNRSACLPVAIVTLAVSSAAAIGTFVSVLASEGSKISYRL